MRIASGFRFSFAVAGLMFGCSGEEAPLAGSPEELERAIALALEESRQEWTTSVFNGLSIEPADVRFGNQALDVWNRTPLTIVQARAEGQYLVEGQEVHERQTFTFTDSRGLAPGDSDQWYVEGITGRTLPPDTRVEFFFTRIDGFIGAAKYEVEPWSWEKKAELDILMEKLDPQQRAQAIARVEESIGAALAAEDAQRRESELRQIEESVSISEAARRADELEEQVLAAKLAALQKAVAILQEREADRRRIEEAQNAELARQHEETEAARQARRREREAAAEAALQAALQSWYSVFDAAESALAYAEQRLDAESTGGAGLTLATPSARARAVSAMGSFAGIPRSGFERIDVLLVPAQAAYTDAAAAIERNDPSFYVLRRDEGRRGREKLRALLLQARSG